MSGERRQLQDGCGKAPGPARIAFDTNVLLDVLLKRSEHLADAAQLWDAADSGRVNGVVPAIAVTTIGYLVERAYDSQQARSDISNVLSVFDVAPVGRSELEGALKSGFADFEDGVIHEAARSFGCDAIVTRNGKDFSEAALPIYTPAELLAVLAAR